MEQIQELLEILKQTPEMALWGLTIWCIYILAKLASVVWALKVVSQLAINKWHDYKIKKIGIEASAKELEINKKLNEIAKREFGLESKKFKYNKEEELSKKIISKFNRETINNVETDEVLRIFDAIKSTNYIHKSDIDKAVKKLMQ